MVPSPIRYVEKVPSVVVDAGLGALLALLSLRLAVGYYPEGYRPFDAGAWVLSITANLVLALRRRAPLAVCVVSCASVATFHLAGYWPELNQLGPPLALYTVATQKRGWQPFAAIGLVGPVMIAGSLATWNGSTADIVAQNLVWIVTLVGFGIGTRRHVERGEALADLTARLRREQEDRERRAVTDERVRIARELHDVVAHHMAVISVQTGLAWYVFDSDPRTARTALRTASDVGREALDEMRRLLAVLRLEVDATGGEAEDGYDPSPGLANLDQLTERVGRAGVPVTVIVTGAARPLPQGIDLCAYRVVQESLTNVVRHARPATATVTVTYGPAELTVRIADDGRNPPAEHGSSPGHGLIGMRERARLYGGTLDAGPRPDRPGYEVVLTLPTTAGSDEPIRPAAVGTGEP